MVTFYSSKAVWISVSHVCRNGHHHTGMNSDVEVKMYDCVILQFYKTRGNVP